MGDTELISVIVPVYNVEKYLKKCIDSILNQTFNNLEILLIDDGSTDRSGSICDAYSERYEKCRTIHKDNAGLGMARNTGLENVKGEYVTFVDSDDWIKLDTIEQMYKALKANRVDFCKSGYIRFQNNGKTVRSVRYNEEFFPGEDAKNKLLPRMVGSSPVMHDSVEMCVCGVLYNTRIIKEHSIRFPSERVLISEDLVFNMDYMQYCNGACLIGYEGYMYRFNPKSLSSQYREDRFDAVCYFYKEIGKKLIKYGYTRDTIYRLKRIFFVYLRMCMTQEKKTVSGHSFRESVNRIKIICNDSLVRRVIAGYPIKKLGKKQKLFLLMIMNRKTTALKLLIEAGVV